MDPAEAQSFASRTGRWPEEGHTRIPSWVYTDPEIFRREMEVFFAGRTWNYVGLACEVPETGSYKRQWIGTRPVVMVRNEAGEINVFENRCAHRQAQICWQNTGRVKDFTCPYHQWNYNLDGRLVGMPFRRGQRGQGGMPADFDLNAHGLAKLRTVNRGGMVWASFAHDGPSFEAYCGPEVLAEIDHVFSGRELVLLGYSRQLIPANWKMYLENLKDPYHATLLHTFYITFGLWRADNRARMLNASEGRHGVMVSENTGRATSAATGEMSRFGHGLALEDMSLVTPIPEFADGRIGGGTVHPSLVVQQQANSLAVRHVIPRGVDATELVWVFFGYADDSDEMTLRRLKHANLVGPAGLVSIDDSEVLKQCQAAADGYAGRAAFLEMGGRGTEPADHMVTETMIRGFYEHYRRVMEL